MLAIHNLKLRRWVRSPNIFARIALGGVTLLLVPTQANASRMGIADVTACKPAAKWRLLNSMSAKYKINQFVIGTPCSPKDGSGSTISLYPVEEPRLSDIQTVLGNIDTKENVIPRNDTKAAIRYAAAARRWDAGGKIIIPRTYENDHGVQDDDGTEVQKSNAERANQFRRDAEQDDPTAAYNLGNAYYCGCVCREITLKQ